jgi:hypothetical protein
MEGKAYDNLKKCANSNICAMISHTRSLDTVVYLNIQLHRTACAVILGFWREGTYLFYAWLQV